MRSKLRANGVAFRRAVWASVALHALAACALILLVRTEKPKPVDPGVDTRAASEPQVRMSLSEVVLDVTAPQPTPPTLPIAAVAEPPPKPQPEVPSPALPNGPIAPAVPRTLPPELLELLRKPAAVAEVPTAPAAPNPSVVDPNVRPAGSANAAAPGVPAIHGALNPNQTVVYVLDCSGSMGGAGKLDAARAALVSTLKQQPTSVRFQVIVYSGTATVLLAGNGSALPATEANVRAAADALGKLEARGKSNHLEAVRSALAFRPDVVLLLTDADDLNVKALKSIGASAPKPIPICVGQVTAEGVQRHHELK